ncbi:hypothetical protein KCP78_17710 [Salmonella enterica subsp. enterica]|nr:hypothetical protein KCP78_17710 [Salmonella enterica subsp. enterica]
MKGRTVVVSGLFSLTLKPILRARWGAMKERSDVLAMWPVKYALGAEGRR